MGFAALAGRYARAVPPVHRRRLTSTAAGGPGPSPRLRHGGRFGRQPGRGRSGAPPGGARRPRWASRSRGGTPGLPADTTSSTGSSGGLTTLARWSNRSEAGPRPASACPATGPPRDPAAVRVLNWGQPVSPPPPVFDAVAIPPAARHGGTCPNPARGVGARRGCGRRGPAGSGGRPPG